MPELLIPAGSPDAVTAAVQNGADAVYISFDRFTGCTEAVNFSDDYFESTVRYCRVRGCRVYLAMNVPVRDDELSEAARLALRAQDAGVDAVILRDFGLARLLRSFLPDMPLFADVNLGFYTQESLAVAAGLGFRRVFLPPELPVEQICRLRENSPVEIAVFIQGPLHASLAGECRLSALSGNGSAACGMCSAPCREPWTLGGRYDTTPLSFKDRCLLKDLPVLTEAGIDCFCVAPRSLRPEFSALAASLYSHALASLAALPSMPEEMTLAFTPRGFAAAEIFERAEAPSSDVLAGKQLDRYCAALRAEYSEAETRRVPVSFAVSAASPTDPIKLGVMDGEGRVATAVGPAPSPVGDLPLTEEALQEPMYRTSGTPFRCEKVTAVINDPELSISSMALDTARRELLYQLSEKRAVPPVRTVNSLPDAPEDSRSMVPPTISFSFLTANQIRPALAAFYPANIYLPLDVFLVSPELIEPFTAVGALPVVSIPQIVNEEEVKALRPQLEQAAALGIHDALVPSLSTAAIAAAAGFMLHGDLSLETRNSLALEDLKDLGFASATLSPELSLTRISRTTLPLPVSIAAYGRLPAMITTTCLMRASAGRCTCSNPGRLQDSRGRVYPVTKAAGCRNVVWDARKIWLADALNRTAAIGIADLRLCFTTESPAECVSVARAYMDGSSWRPNDITRGYYFRG